jgi:hypothetical protein
MAQPVITIDAALSALASAKTPGELIQLSNQAAALRVCEAGQAWRLTRDRPYYCGGCAAGPFAAQAKWSW